MPDPHDTLAIFAEVSVALAGFSGIVIAFGGRSLGSLNQLEIRRLSNLFILSGLALTLSLLWLALLHIELEEPNLLWRSGSGIVFALITPWLIWDVVRVYRLDDAERAEVNTVVLLTANSLAVAALLLQIFNVLMLMKAWPFFLALVIMIAGAFQQFILLVRMGMRPE